MSHICPLAVVLHAAVPIHAGPDDQDTLVQAGAVQAALERLGWRVERLPFADQAADRPALATRLRALAPAVVVNLVESIAGSSRGCAAVPAWLAGLGLPYTGSPQVALALADNKLAAKRAMLAHGIATPPWRETGAETIDFGADAPSQPGTLYVIKSVTEHASHGLDESSVVMADEISATLAERSARVGGTWYAERYVLGREFNISLLEPEPAENGDPDAADALPPAEMMFAESIAPERRIVGFDAKWREDSPAYQSTVRRFLDITRDGPLAQRLSALARRCWPAFRLAGYARVDLRVEHNGRPYVIDVNANPCLSPDAGFAAAAEAGGIGYDALIERLVRVAVAARPIRPALRPRPVDPLRGVPGVTRPPVPASSRHPGPDPAPDPAPGRRETAGRRDPLRAYRIRTEATMGDIGAVEALVAATKVFSAAEVVIAGELVSERLAGGDASGYHFLFAETTDSGGSLPGRLAGYACFGPIPGTIGAFDLYWIAVDPARQGQGLAGALLRMALGAIAAHGGRRIFVDTSARAAYAPAHALYQRCGLTKLAELPDFYAEGDAKLIFGGAVGTPLGAQEFDT